MTYIQTRATGTPRTIGKHQLFLLGGPGLPRPLDIPHPTADFRYQLHSNLPIIAYYYYYYYYYSCMFTTRTNNTEKEETTGFQRD